MEKHINTPLTEESLRGLKAGDRVLITGDIYSARDAAHKRLIEILDQGGELPFPIEGSVIYYMGPTPPKPGQAVGSAGPTTSYRMDSYAPKLLDLGLKGMIGKGERNEEVKAAIKKNKAVYFAAIGGAGALISKSIYEAEIVAYEDLGAEAIRRLKVKDFPCIVVIDNEGNNLYELGQWEYLNTVKKD